MCALAANPNGPIGDIPPICLAVQGRSGETVEALLHAGAKTEWSGFSSLIYAVMQDQSEECASRAIEEIISNLIDHGADLSFQTENGLTAVHLAVHRNQASALHQLLEAGAPVNVVSSFGTPLDISVITCSKCIFNSSTNIFFFHLTNFDVEYSILINILHSLQLQ